MSLEVLSIASLHPGYPHRDPTESEAPFTERFLTVYVPRKRTPSRFPNGAPMERDSRFQSLLLHISQSPNKQVLMLKQNFTFVSKSPVKDPPSLAPSRGRYGECSVPKGNGLFIHSFVSLRVPSQGALPRNRGKITCHRQRSPTRTEGLHTTGCALVSQRDRLRHCYYYPRAMPSSSPGQPMREL